VPELQEPMPELRGAGVTLEPLAAGHEDRLRAIRETPEVAVRWGPLEDDFPLEDEPKSTRFAILVDGEVAGMIQFQEETEPDYRHAEVDLFLAPEHHGQGLGTDAMVTLTNHLLEERGHHRIVLSVDTDNEPAIRCYEKSGFRRVGVTRYSGRNYRTGEWADEFFMELVRLPL